LFGIFGLLQSLPAVQAKKRFKTLKGMLADFS